jgi:hypothetical protein
LSSCAGLVRKKEPDLLQITPAEERRFRKPPRLVRYEPRVTSRSCWQIHTSLQGREALADEDETTFAQTAGPRQLSQWILLDLGEECRFQQIVQVHADPGSFPRRYRVDVAGHEGFPYDLEFLGTGTPGRSVAILRQPVKARFVRLTAISAEPCPWSVSELYVH